LDVIVNFFSFPLHASIETPTPSDHEAERSWSWTGHEAGGTAGLVMKQGARLGKSIHLDHTHSHACIEDGNTYLLMMKKWYLN
jgi:hypothetical protein